MIRIEDITLRIAGRALLEGASATVPAGAKVGLVGRNGSGKTTLLRAILGEIPLEAGRIGVPRGARIGQVEQEAPGADDILLNIVLAADRERAELLCRAESERDPAAIAEIHTRLADIEAHSAPARAGAILSGLGFDEKAQQLPASSFSGGWRMRVALAAALFARPDILLLDEPTNYLDLEGTLWLENFIARYAGTVLIISHDRDLLNRAVDSILHLENCALQFYRGNFDSFAAQRAAKLQLQEKMRARQEARRKHMQAFVDRFRAKASKARQAQSRLKMLEKMEPVPEVMENRSPPIRLPAPAKLLASPIIRLEDVDAGYGADSPVLRGLDLRIDQDDRIALLGANGNGKSTFAKLLAERLPHVTGRITRAQGLRVAMFAQHQLDDLHADRSPVEHVRPLMAGVTEAKIRARVAAMGLAEQRMDTRAEHLSGGEKARLLLGLTALEGPQLLILDEPTNHLDMESREALMQALNDFPGAVILISHDRHLIEATADRLWLVKDGSVREYDGDIGDYRVEVLAASGRPGSRERRGEERRAQPQQKRRDAAQRRRDLAPLRGRIGKLEAEMARLGEMIRAIDRELASPDLYSANPARGAELARKRTQAERRLAEIESEWLAISEEYESLAAG